jgi:hypothetical protein
MRATDHLQRHCHKTLANGEPRGGLKTVNVQGREVGNSGLSTIHRLWHLKYESVQGSMKSRNGLAPLLSLPAVRWISLWTQVPPEMQNGSLALDEHPGTPAGDSCMSRLAQHGIDREATPVAFGSSHFF